MNIKKDKIKNRLLTLSLLFIIVSCNENPIDDDFNFKNQSNIVEDKIMTILGEQYPNPYSVSNIQNAYQYLKNNGENIGNLNITATDLYVRFLPQDTAQYNLLNNDTSLILFDYPLDYEIEKFGDYYHDPNIEEGNYTWLYTTVPINYQFNPSIEYEILDSCYIAQDDNENTITDNDKLEQTSFTLLGLDSIFINHNELNTKGWFSGKKPEGKFKFYDTKKNEYIPIKGVVVVCHNIVKCGKAILDEDGYYKMNKKFHTNVFYNIKWYNCHKLYSIHYPIILSNSFLGVYSKNGFDLNLSETNNCWKLANINNSAYEYYNFCSDNEIFTPPLFLKIWMTNTTNKGCAPMLPRITHPIGRDSNCELADFFINIIYGLPATLFINHNIIELIAPDVIIGGKNRTSSKAFYAQTVHELSHASHFSQVGSAYWAKYISYIMTYGAYGNDNKGENAGICGVGEMWGYALEDLLTNDKYGMVDIHKGADWIRADILHNLMKEDIVSPKDVFDCLTPLVITQNKLKEALQAKSPNNYNIIETRFDTLNNN